MNKEQVNSFNINTNESYNTKKEIKNEEKTLNPKTPKKIIQKSNIKTEESNNIKNNIINKIDVPPFKSKEEETSKKEKENIIKNENFKKEENEVIIKKEKQPQRKKEWKSWSSQEKLMFYELIANGGNYSSLQKLFKTMNDVNKKYIININQKIGTKSTEKIRDFYYRMLKHVNLLLKRAGEIGIYSRNRDEVLLALSCYGKLITSSPQKNVN